MKNLKLSSLVSLYCLFSITISHAQSDIDFRLIPIDCDYGMTAFLAGAGPDYEAFYDWGDGSTSFADWPYVDHIYSEPGVYTVTAYHNDVFYTEEVSIEDCGCPEVFEFVTFSGQCNQLEINLETYLYAHEDYAVEWDFGDGQGYTSSTYTNGYHTYADEGIYQVSAFFTGPGCVDGVTITTDVEVELCQGSCYPYFDYAYDEESCTYMWFNETAPETTIWTVDGEFVAEGTWASDQVLDPGLHLLCYDIAANDYCPFGQSECVELETPECDQNCPEISVIEQFCDYASFSYSGDFEGLFHQWTVLQDGELISTFEGNSTEIITFPESGVYQVGVSDAFNCNGEVEPFYIDVEVESCLDDCAEILVFETEECGVYDFSMLGNIVGNSYCWEVWSSEYFFTYFDEQTTTFEFTEAGTYFITVTNAEFCLGQEELILEINVPDCEEGVCINAVGGVQTGCTTAVLTVYADFEIEEIHWFINGETIIAGNNFEYDFGSSDNQIIEIEYISGVDCNEIFDGWQIPIFMDTAWCQEDCFLIANYEVLEDGMVSFSASTSDPEANITWLIEEEWHEGESFMFQFMEPGVHTVCAFYESPDCPYGVEDCIEVIILPEECPEISYELTEDCHTVNFEFIGFINGPWYCWDVIGDGYYDTYFDGESTSITFPGPGVYQVGVTNALLCDTQEDYLITIEIPDCDSNCVNQIYFEGQDCGEAFFIIPESVEAAFFDFGDGNSLETSEEWVSHAYEFPGVYAVCVAYFNEVCDSLISECLFVEILPCNFDCEAEIQMELLGNNTYSFFVSNASENSLNWNINGSSFTNQNPIIYTFEQADDYDVCVEIESSFCGLIDECITVSVMDEECEGITISLESLLERNSDIIQTLDCVLSLDGVPFWEDAVNLTSENEIEELEFCLPNGCYEFSISNADPLVLGSLVFLLDAINDLDFEYDLDLDLISGSASIQFGVGTECTTAILEYQYSEVSFFPVPASDVVYIKKSDQVDILEVVDARGKLIFSSESNNLNSVNVSSWSEGMYLFRYLENEKWFSRKIQVNH